MSATIAPRRTRRILAPLATLAVAGALVIGSGADFTSTSNNSVSVAASGSLSQANSRDGKAVFNVSNLKPGDTVTGSVTITNTGTMPQNFSATETATSTFSPGSLSMTVTEVKGTTRTPVYSGNFGGFATKQLGVFTTGEARTYEYVVTFAQSAGNQEQNKSASAAYQWNGNQTSAVTVAQTAADLSTATNANP